MIETDNSNVKEITEMKPPKNSKEVSKFLGMAGWYQKFIAKYGDICEPLYRLKKKWAKFNWSTEAQDYFDKIKRALTEATVLQLPNFTEQFNLFTDASGFGIDAVLNQNHRPIEFASRTLNKAERSYTVTERECLAVIWALNKYKTDFGSLPVGVITDHAACMEWDVKETDASIDKYENVIDEAHFWLNGYVNKQSCRIWSEANPQVYVETPLHPEKLTVWCALWAGAVIPTYHTARATINLLKYTFVDRLISRFGPVNWPPRSCDLTPLDYFLWGYVKSLVYADKPQTLDHLEDNILRVIADIRPQMLEKVIENWTSRLDYIRVSRGSPMPEIIFKM
ncbi:retrovirus-related Pol polyprotein from transposon 297 [Trichonephila clavipes]|nr:retrovirus-related Pol polyprotein from transposon 297 [Trichonephila clavipes]